MWCVFAFFLFLHKHKRIRTHAKYTYFSSATVLAHKLSGVCWKSYMKVLPFISLLLCGALFSHFSIFDSCYCFRCNIFIFFSKYQICNFFSSYFFFIVYYLFFLLLLSWFFVFLLKKNFLLLSYQRLLGGSIGGHTSIHPRHRIRCLPRRFNTFLMFL